MEMRRDVFHTIADLRWREIIGLLCAQSLNLNAVVAHFQVSRPAVSKHIRNLMECGLIVVVQNGRERFCSADIGKLKEVDQWLGHYRKFWNNKLDSLGTFWRGIQHGKGIRIRIINLKNSCYGRVYNASIEKVWKAITNKDQMKEWYFPAGSCSDASELLGYLMERQGFGKYMMVYGENYEGVTDVWLESDSELMDITSDQFTSSNSDVIIKEKEGKTINHLDFIVKRSSVIEAKYIFINYFNVLREIETRIGDSSS